MGYVSKIQNKIYSTYFIIYNLLQILIQPAEELAVPDD